MKILYVDTANTISNIRIAEQTIFYKELPKFGHDVFFLLAENELYCRPQNVFTYKSNILSKIFINIPLIKSLKRIKKIHSYDLIVVRNSTALGFIPLLYAKKKGILFVYIKAFPILEMLKHELKISQNFICSGNLFLKYNINNLVEKYILKHTDIIIPRTKSYLNYLHNSKRINKQKMLPIPMGFDNEVLQKIDIQELENIQKKFCSNSEKLLLYFGEMDKRRNLDFIIDVFERTSKIISNIKLLMIGGKKEEQNNILNYIENKRLIGQIVLLEAIPREELYNYIAASDLTLSPIPPLFIYRISSPTKVIESLGCGTPVIVNEEIEDQHQIIVKSNGGYSVPYDENSFSNAIIKLLSNNIKLKEMGKSGQKYILENRTYEKLGKELELFILKKMKYEKLKSQE